MALALSLSKFISGSTIRPIAAVSRSTNVFRSFGSSSSALRFEEGDEEDRTKRDVVDRHSSHDDIFFDASDAIPPTRSLNPFFNIFDQVIDGNPFLTRPDTVRSVAGYPRSWEAKETDSALHLRVDMPGLGKDDVKVSMENNTLLIIGKGGQEYSDRKYSSRIELPENMFKIDSIKAEMKNGVLKVAVPKLKQEERPDVFHVAVE